MEPEIPVMRASRFSKMSRVVDLTGNAQVMSVLHATLRGVALRCLALRNAHSQIC